MKKLLSILAAAVLILTGCQQTVQPTLSINTIINSGAEEVDLSNIPCDEDVTVTKAVTIKNGDFGGKTLTVNVSGVTLESAKNVNVVVAEAVGDGDFTVSGSDVSSLKVLGGGVNSIHVKDTVLKVINIAKANVRVALEGKSNVAKLQLKKGVTAKVEVKSSDVKVEAAEVVSEDGTKVEGESVQIAVDDGVTFTAPTGSVKKPADTHKHSYGDWKTEKEPTCTEKGKKKRTCSCGNEETEEIAAKGHSFEDGWTTDSAGHWHKSTCGHDEEKSGYGDHKDEDNDGTCDVCSWEDHHTYGDWVIDEPATCEKEGSKHRSCTHNGCDKTETEAIEIDPDAHSFKTAWTMDPVTGQHWHKATCSHKDVKGDLGDWHDDDPEDGYCDICHKDKFGYSKPYEE